MAGERIRKRKLLLFCVAALIVLQASACVPQILTIVRERQVCDRLEDVEALLEKNDFDGAMKLNEDIVRRAAPEPPADTALFSMGIIAAHPRNPKRDYREALQYFNRILVEFPGSPVASEAKVWAGVLEDINRVVEIEVLSGMQKMLEKDDFEGATMLSEDILQSSPKAPPADTALFALGIISVHPRNVKKDYRKALQYFNRVTKEFPDSPVAGAARVWAGVLKDIRRTAEIEILSSVQVFLEKNDFEGAVKFNEDILRASPKAPPADTALYALGIISAHYRNPKKDYRKALKYFNRVVEEFPDSPVADSARVWVGVLEDINRAVQIDLEIEQKKKELLR